MPTRHYQDRRAGHGRLTDKSGRHRSGHMLQTARDRIAKAKKSGRA